MYAQVEANVYEKKWRTHFVSKIEIYNYLVKKIIKPLLIGTHLFDEIKEMLDQPDFLWGFIESFMFENFDVDKKVVYSEKIEKEIYYSKIKFNETISDYIVLQVLRNRVKQIEHRKEDLQGKQNRFLTLEQIQKKAEKEIEIKMKEIVNFHFPNKTERQIDNQVMMEFFHEIKGRK